MYKRQHTASGTLRLRGIQCSVRLYKENPKEWDYLMFHICKDADGNDYGWAKVLDYIGVGWDPDTIGGNCKGQMNLDDFMDY